MGIVRKQKFGYSKDSYQIRNRSQVYSAYYFPTISLPHQLSVMRLTSLHEMDIIWLEYCYHKFEEVLL